MPVTVIGKGTSALKEFISECLEAGGSPTFVAKYGAREYTDRVIARCYGASDKVPGGFIVDLPADVVKKIAKRKGDATWLLEELA
ncbi:MAG: hypothetical protein DRO40_11095 [Thermoprotei archaeon]|nr:MAG: hypothetical protein DRO40_11095 [Thermoprotei archaeon]